MRLPPTSDFNSLTALFMREVIPDDMHYYSITISSNHAKNVDSIEAYKYVLNRLIGTKVVTLELSKKGKYHYHGVLATTSQFRYSNWLEAVQTESPWQYDMHIKFLPLETEEDVKKWIFYCSKDHGNVRTFMRNLAVPKPEKTCIPEIKKVTKYKEIEIKKKYKGFVKKKNIIE